ncbi:MAG: hypothetical protein ACOYMI_05130 [Phycisphaerales bacterium]
MRTIARILVAAACIGLLLGGGWLTVSLVQTARLQRQVAELERAIEAERALRARVLERLGSARRLARIEVVQQHRADDPSARALSAASVAELPASGILTTLDFIELDPDGREIGRRRVRVPGTTVFLDAWTVRFPQGSVAEADPLRGRTLTLLRRVYSDRMPPADGVALDTPGAVPGGYAASAGARFEQALWKRFWSLATDAEAAQQAGVRVAQGEAVYKPVAPGQRYDLEVESSGGLILKPADAP